MGETLAKVPSIVLIFKRKFLEDKASL